MEFRVSGPLSYSQDGSFQLPRPSFHGGDRIHGSSTVVIVGMRREDEFFSGISQILRVCPKICEKRSDRPRIRSSQGIGYIDDGRTCLDCFPDGFKQEFPLRIGRILRRPLDFIPRGCRISDARADILKDFRSRHIQLVSHMCFRGGDEGMDPRACRTFKGTMGSIDILEAPS